MIGLIHSVQHYSLQDGPGIRSTVFFKGCPLRCQWCSNPDTQESHPEILLDTRLCPPGCQECVAACPTQALAAAPATGVRLLRERCSACGNCLAACQYGALRKVGSYVSTDELVAELLREKPFYEASGGGVTLSGGEPLFQRDFLRELVVKLKERGIGVVLDTSGYGPWALLRSLAEDVDLFLYDIKHPDGERHRLLTGRRNDLILANLSRLYRLGARIAVRFVVVPGVNDDPSTLEGLRAVLAGMEGVFLELLPYHCLGENKYRMLGREYPMEGLEPPSPERMRELESWFSQQGIKVRVVW